MPQYEYRVRDAAGVIQEGLVEADNKEIAVETLKDRGFSLLSIDEHQEEVLSWELPFLRGIPVKDMVVFSRQFSVLVGAKVPIVRAIKTVSRQTKNPRLTRILSDVGTEVEAGTPLSLAMAKHPQAFSSFFVNIIKSGETTGRLEEVMNYLADQMEKDYDLTSRIRGAMTYPLFVLAALFAIGIVMMTYVVPKLTASLLESGTALPWTTRWLIAVSGFMTNNLILLAAAVVVAAILFRLWISRPDGRLAWDTLVLRIPIFGPIIRHMTIVRFTRSMTTLINGGVDVPAALEVCADIVGNEHYRHILQETQREVSDGNSIATVFLVDRLTPSMIPQMLTVGEETGRLAVVLAKLTEFYDREINNSVANLVSAIEPLIMLVMGLAVGVMVAAIMMPMYQMAMNI